MTKQEKENIKAVLSMQRTLIDNIYNACSDNSKNFKVDYTPITFVKTICDIAWNGLNNGMNLSLLKGTDLKNAKMVLRLNKTMLDTIHNTCKDNAKSFHVDYVPVKFLKSVCDNVYAVTEKGILKGFGN